MQPTTPDLFGEVGGACNQVNIMSNSKMTINAPAEM